MTWQQRLERMQNCWSTDAASFMDELASIEMSADSIAAMRVLLEKCFTHHADLLLTRQGWFSAVELLQWLLMHDYDSKMHRLLASLKSHPDRDFANVAALACKQIEDFQAGDWRISSAALGHSDGLHGGSRANAHPLPPSGHGGT